MVCNIKGKEISKDSAAELMQKAISGLILLERVTLDDEKQIDPKSMTLWQSQHICRHNHPGFKKGLGCSLASSFSEVTHTKGGVACGCSRPVATAQARSRRPNAT